MNRQPDSQSLHDLCVTWVAVVLVTVLGWAAAGCATTPPPGAEQKTAKAAQAPPQSSSRPPAAAPAGAAAPAASGDAAIPRDQLDSLVAPVALYPDPLLAQVLAAATYPVELVELQQWLSKNSTLKGQALADAAAKQQWDASVQGLANFPDVVKRLTDDIQWTTDLGNAFLAQQQDVMDAVQRMRAKAQKNGNLKTNEQQVVETKQVETQQVIVIEQADPQVVYVPTYNPTVVYGPPVYPYPPIYYPPPPPYGAMAVSFTFGIAMGAAMSGGWGYGCGWGYHSTVVVNNNNFYVNKQNVRTGNPGGGNWQHNPQHRGGTPYPTQGTAGRYGGGSGAAAGRGGAGASTRPSGGSADRIGTQDVSRGGGQSREAFGGGSSGNYSGSRANASSARGSHSMGSRGGGGRGGGGRRR